MFKKEVKVRCESGLHNKQATFFVQKANEFEDGSDQSKNHSSRQPKASRNYPACKQRAAL